MSAISKSERFEDTVKPLDALLAAYCAGALDRPTHALVASHLLLNPTNRFFVAALEDLTAGEVARVEPKPLRNRDARLSAVFASASPLAGSAPSSVLPAPLLRLIGSDLSDLKWRTKIPGVREYRISESERGEASMLWVGAGRRIPSHTHDGSEITLVLKGAFADVTGRYGRGDIAIAEADLDHRPMTDENEDCICFAVTDAPLRLTGPVGRILDQIFGRPH
jgi:putative transcriptional regulator